MNHVLLIDDDVDFAFGVSAMLGQVGFKVQLATSARDAESMLRAARFDAVLLDIHLPDLDGIQLISRIHEIDMDTPVICLTALSSAESAVRAMRNGATDYLTKPAGRAALVSTLESAMARVQARRKVDSILRSGPGGPAPVGTSTAWQRAMDLIHAAANSPRTTVLLTGEPGVGKEVAAALVHRLSKRQQAAFITVNAACLSPHLIESELFGHEVGSFTGAQRQRRGLFEMAAGGTLFLDEIGELPLDLQGKLLRVLEGHSFRRVGGERELLTDVRLVCATNRVLATRVREGLFRADLYERLRVFEIPLPPLRERPTDISDLALYFSARLSAEMGCPRPSLSQEVLDLLREYDWPGNVRELRNVIERALVLAAGSEIGARHLPSEIRRRGRDAAASQTPSQPHLALPLEAVIRRHVCAVFDSTGGNLTRAAAHLGISRVALRRRLQVYGLKPLTS